MKRLLFVSIALLAMFGMQAQVTSGAISGRVLDNSKNPSVGATVKITHVPSGTVYGGKTRSNGDFEVRGLRVGGPYKVEASSVGSGKDIVENVYVDLGDPTNVSLRLEGSTLMKEVYVTSSRNSVINSDKTGASTNINSQLINSMPSGSRNLSDMTRLSPQAGVSFSSGLNNGNSFGGRDGRYNNVQVNGANLNNGFGLSSGLTPGGSGQPISLDAIEEIQVGVSPFDVRQTGFTGANINAVTRSGTNEFHGSAYMFIRPNGLVGDKVDTVNLDISKTKNSNTIFGARIGGPIIKNKLFFFGNFEYEKAILTGNTFVSKNSTLTGNVSNVLGSDLDNFKNHLESKYGYLTGPYEGYDDFKNENNKMFLRLDWNVNTNHKFNISFSNMNAFEDVLVNSTSGAAGASRLTYPRVGFNSLSFQNSNYSFLHNVRSLAAELNSVMNPIMNNQLLATYSYVQDKRSTPGSIFPFIDITTGGSNNIMSAGTELFSYKNDLINNNFVLTDNLTIDLKENQLTIGASYEHSLFENSFLSGGNLYYRYNSLNDFINNARPSVFALTYPLPSQNGNTYAKASYGQLGFYVQDKFSVSPRFTLKGGVRFDYPFYDNSYLATNKGIEALTFKNLDGSDLKFQTNSFPSSTLMISPRVAFNWDANGDKTLQVRGGLGVFTGRIPMVWMTNQAGGIGTITTNAIYTPTSTPSINTANVNFYTSLEDLASKNPALFNSLPKNENSVPSSNIALIDKELKMPQVLRTDLGLDYKLPWYGLIATGEIMASRDIQNVMQFNANLPAAQSTISAIGDNRPRWTSNRLTSATGQAMVLTNTYSGYATSLSVGIQRQARKGLYGSLFFTRTWSEDISSNPGSQATSAWNGLPNLSSPNTQSLTTSQYNTPVRVVGSLSYKFEYAKKKMGTTVSLYYEGASPGRYSYLYGGDMNGDGVNADLIYIPNSAEEINFTDIKNASNVTVYSVGQQKVLWEQFVEQDEYLREHKGQYASRYGATYPWYNRIDLRLLQDFYFNVKDKKQTIQFSLDIINLPNLINSAWGVQKQLGVGGLSNTNPVLRPETISATSSTLTNPTNPKYTLNYDNLTYKLLNYNETFVNNNSPFSTWYMQFGARYIF